MEAGQMFLGEGGTLPNHEKNPSFHTIFFCGDSIRDSDLKSNQI